MADEGEGIESVGGPFCGRHFPDRGDKMTMVCDGLSKVEIYKLHFSEECGRRIWLHDPIASNEATLVRYPDDGSREEG